MEIPGIKPDVIEAIRALAKKYGIDKVILFGSRARGDYTRKSDIDLAVLGGNVTRFALDIEESTPTLLTFDVIDFNGEVHEDLLKSINGEGVVLYEKAR